MGVECWHKTTLLAADVNHVLVSGLGETERHAAPLRALSQLLLSLLARIVGVSAGQDTYLKQLD